jgi:vacuolar iron transporter family protein
MKKAINSGIGFGLTSGVITTLGLIVGLNSGTHSKLTIIGGVLIIAFADALSDSFGMHIVKESEKQSKEKIWTTTLTTFIAKLIIALTFLIPIIFLNINSAVYASILWGIFLIASLSFRISKQNKHNALTIISEHLIIMFIVIATSYYIGIFVSNFFGTI